MRLWLRKRGYSGGRCRAGSWERRETGVCAGFVPSNATGLTFVTSALPGAFAPQFVVVERGDDDAVADFSRTDQGRDFFYGNQTGD